MKATLRRGLALILAICLVAALGICASAREYNHSDFYGGSGYGAQGACKLHEVWISMGTTSNYTVSADGDFYYHDVGSLQMRPAMLKAEPAKTFTKASKNVGSSEVLYMEATHRINGTLVYSSGIVYPD